MGLRPSPSQRPSSCRQLEGYTPTSRRRIAPSDKNGPRRRRCGGMRSQSSLRGPIGCLSKRRLMRLHETLAARSM